MRGRSPAKAKTTPVAVPSTAATTNRMAMPASRASLTTYRAMGIAEQVRYRLTRGRGRRIAVDRRRRCEDRGLAAAPAITRRRRAAAAPARLGRQVSPLALPQVARQASRLALPSIGRRVSRRPRRGRAAGFRGRRRSRLAERGGRGCGGPDGVRRRWTWPRRRRFRGRGFWPSGRACFRARRFRLRRSERHADRIGPARRRSIGHAHRIGTALIDAKGMVIGSARRGAVPNGMPIGSARRGAVRLPPMAAATSLMAPRDRERCASRAYRAAAGQRYPARLRAAIRSAPPFRLCGLGSLRGSARGAPQSRRGVAHLKDDPPLGREPVHRHRPLMHRAAAEGRFSDDRPGISRTAMEAIDADDRTIVEAERHQLT